MTMRGTSFLSVSVLALGLLGACSVVKTDFSATDPETIEVEGKNVQVRVVDAGDSKYDVMASYSEVATTFDTLLQTKSLYTEDDPARHALYVEASKKALESRCGGDLKPFLRAYSPVPWEPFTGRFVCL